MFFFPQKSVLCSWATRVFVQICTLFFEKHVLRIFFFSDEAVVILERLDESVIVLGCFFQEWKHRF